jgi:hypothetical protein
MSKDYWDVLQWLAVGSSDAVVSDNSSSAKLNPYGLH